MEQCTSCGAGMVPDADWCGQCYAVRGPAGMTASGPFSPSVAVLTAPAAPSIMSADRAAQTAYVPLLGKTRWRKTPTTFGPLGRVLFTLALVLPVPLVVVWAVLSGGFGAAGAVIWIFIVMPMGLRDVWKAGTIPLN